MARAVRGADAVVNAVSLYFEHDGLTFEAIHMEAAARVAQAHGEVKQAHDEAERARLERDQLRQQMDQLSTDLASSQEHNQSLTESQAMLPCRHSYRM